MTHTQPGSHTTTQKDNPDIFGIWWRSADRAEDEPVNKWECPWVKGFFTEVLWNRLEPREGHFHWPYLRKCLGQATSRDFYVQLIIWTGPDAPRWLYDKGVPEVITTGGNHPDWTYPYFLDETYKHYFFRMHRAVADYIKNDLYPNMREKIVFMQSAEGKTGDPEPWAGDPLDPKYTITEPQWWAFRCETWKMLYDLYNPVGIRLQVSIRSEDLEREFKWISENTPGIWLKNGHQGHGFHVTGEAERMKIYGRLTNTPDKYGNYVRVRSEFDLVDSCFYDARIWNMYWLNLWWLHSQLDIPSLQRQMLLDPNYVEGFTIYTRYAGIREAAESPGAFCALRDGLDSDDTTRFPEDIYGSNDSKEAKMKRQIAIANAFAKYGALQPDPEAAVGEPMESRHAKGMNDIGVGIVTENYSRFLTQYDPNGTSRGYWRVGPKDQPYGRFARGFDHAAGKNAMYFSLNKDLFGGLPLKGETSLKLRVVYFDRGKGSWELRYDAKDDPDKAAFAVTHTDSGMWKEKSVEISDGYFGSRCPNNTDLYLKNTGDEDSLFHLIEVSL